MKFTLRTVLAYMFLGGASFALRVFGLFGLLGFVEFYFYFGMDGWMGMMVVGGWKREEGEGRPKVV